MKSTKLAVVKSATTLNLPATQPPPRKEDIINAMVERARVKHQEEADKVGAQRKKAEDELDQAILKELEKNPESFEVEVTNWGKQATVSHRLKIFPPHIAKLQKAILDIPRVYSFEPATVKKQIREGMNTAGDRVKALLASPDAVKKLDQALESIASKKP